jgi:hypothetical protein
VRGGNVSSLWVRMRGDLQNVIEGVGPCGMCEVQSLICSCTRQGAGRRVSSFTAVECSGRAGGAARNGVMGGRRNCSAPGGPQPHRPGGRSPGHQHGLQAVFLKQNSGDMPENSITSTNKRMRVLFILACWPPCFAAAIHTQRSAGHIVSRAGKSTIRRLPIIPARCTHC